MGNSEMPIPAKGQEKPKDPREVSAEKKAKEAAAAILKRDGVYNSDYWKAYYNTYYSFLNEAPLTMAIKNIKTNLDELLKSKFLAKQIVSYEEVETIINGGLPSLDKEDLNYPEKRDDRIVILRPGIEALVEQFNKYQDQENDTDYTDRMIKNITGDLVENHLNRIFY
jgi:hypothetical protein